MFRQVKAIKNQVSAKKGIKGVRKVF